jgi:hypothetical protein
MKVDISTQEYRDLLDVLSIADWVMMAHKTGQDSRIGPYEKLIQKFYSLAKDMGYDTLVEYDAREGRYHLTRTFEDTTRSWEFIDEFTEDTFWDELTHRMTERDMARQVGGYEKLRSLSREDWSALEAPIHERYSEEFYQNGIERMAIVEHYEHDRAKPVRTHD